MLAIALLVIPFHFSNAANVVDLVTNPAKSIISGLAWFVSTILYLVGYIFSKFVLFGGLFFNWTLELNAGIIDSPVVSIGWGLTRDIANLGFVLLIIIIAFATILRQGNFQMKTALPKLIAAALLINFSLIIAAVFIDAAGIFMSFFLNNAFESSSTQGGISQALATSLSLHKGLQPPEITSNTDLSTFGVGVMNYIANIVFLDIMTIVGAITMFALGGMFLLRYLNLGILLILLPGAILGWVAGSKVWGDWTGKFLNYVFFGPIAAFFVYLALKSTLIFESQAKTYFNTAAAGDSVLQNLAGNIGSMAMLVSLLLLGLATAESMAKELSVGGLKMANGAIKTFRNVTVGGTGRLISGAGKGIFGGAYAESLAKSGQKFMGSRFALVRGLGRQSIEQSKQLSEQYGKPWAKADIGRNLFEGAAAGLGFSAGKIRMGQEKAEKSEEKEITRLAKKMVDFNVSKASDEAYMNEYNSKIKEQEGAILTHLRSEAKGDIKKTTSEFEKRSFIEKIKKNPTFSDIDVNKILESNNNDLEMAKKFFEREGDIRNLIDQTKAERSKVEEILKKNFNNFKDTKNELLGKQKQK